MNSDKKSISYSRVAFILIGLVLGAVVLIFGGEVTAGNSEALRILVTIFSILTGIMIAVISAIGTPEDLLPFCKFILRGSCPRDVHAH